MKGGNEALNMPKVASQTDQLNSRLFSAARQGIQEVLNSS